MEDALVLSPSDGMGMGEAWLVSSPEKRQGDGWSPCMVESVLYSNRIKRR